MQPALHTAFITACLTGFLGLLLHGCSTESGPEAEVATVIEEMRDALEAGETEAFMAHVSPDYRDAEGHDHAAIARQVDAWRERGGDRIGIDMDIERLEVDRAGRARVQLTAGFSGAEYAGRLRGRLGERYRLDLSLDHEEQEHWRVVHAEWGPDE